MLPSGHLAAGYLATKASSLILSGYFPQAAEPRFIIFGMLVSVLVDLDDLYAFFKIGRLVARTETFDHRKFITHTPFFHLIISLLLASGGIAFSSQALILISIYYFVGTYTHLILDSFGYGIRWLWPFGNKLYALARAGKDFDISPELPTFKYWAAYFKEYSKTPTCFLEFFLIVSAALVFLKIY